MCLVLYVKYNEDWAEGINDVGFYSVSDHNLSYTYVDSENLAYALTAIINTTLIKKQFITCNWPEFYSCN